MPSGGTVSGRFGYTGRAWLPGVGLHYYKARMYSPMLGRFMQTDPIGYGDGPNWYQYVSNDPINFVDPLGLEGAEENCGGENCDEPIDVVSLYPSFGGGFGGGGGCGGSSRPREPDIVVTKKIKPKRKRVVAETPSLDPFTFWNHFRHGGGETICLTKDQFNRVVDLAKPVAKVNPNGANLVSYYRSPLENTFGRATLYYSRGVPVGFYDFYDFNLGAGRGLMGELKTIGGAVAGAGATPFGTKYPC